MKKKLYPGGASGDANIFALLMGLDCYLGKQSAGPGCFSNLQGCVNDVSRVTEFLRNAAGVPDQNILKLTSTNIGRREPAEPRDHWPTYRNIIAAFRKLREMARPGDRVYIHYSGHGGRVRTPSHLQAIKGDDGFDEVLVPIDYVGAEDRFLRDFEVAYLLQELVDRKLIVTIVLDSCHAGGTLRGRDQSRVPDDEGVAVRSIGIIDTVLPPHKSLVASAAELSATWQALARAAKNKPALDNPSWLLESEGYVLLAASRASEFAHEFAFNGSEKNGALTFALLDSLKHLGISSPLKLLYDRILATILGQFPNQTPQLQGRRNRGIFGGETVPWDLSVAVLSVDLRKQEISLNAGQAQGIQPGILFSLYSQTGFDLNSDKPLAVVEITKAGPTSSLAQIRERLSKINVQPGDQAVLLALRQNGGPARLRLVAADGNSKNKERGAALSALKLALAPKSRAQFVTSASNQREADYRISINSFDEYVIRGRDGLALPNLRPAIRITEPQASARVIERLVHLTKYHNLWELRNSAGSTLWNRISIELSGSDPDSTHAIRRRHQHRLPTKLTLTEGKQRYLTIRNHYSEVLNISVLELRPDWSIAQIFPRDAAFYESLDPGQSLQLRLAFALPLDYAQGVFTVKVLATTSPANFRWLELHPLDQPFAGGVWRGERPESLSQFLAKFNGEWNNFREGRLTETTPVEWFTRQVEIRVFGAVNHPSEE